MIKFSPSRDFNGCINAHCRNEKKILLDKSVDWKLETYKEYCILLNHPSTRILELDKVKIVKSAKIVWLDTKNPELTWDIIPEACKTDLVAEKIKYQRKWYFENIPLDGLDRYNDYTLEPDLNHPIEIIKRLSTFIEQYKQRVEELLSNGYQQYQQWNRNPKFTKYVDDIVHKFPTGDITLSEETVLLNQAAISEIEFDNAYHHTLKLQESSKIVGENNNQTIIIKDSIDSMQTNGVIKNIDITPKRFESDSIKYQITWFDGTVTDCEVGGYTGGGDGYSKGRPQSSNSYERECKEKREREEYRTEKLPILYDKFKKLYLN